MLAASIYNLGGRSDFLQSRVTIKARWMRGTARYHRPCRHTRKVLFVYTECRPANLPPRTLCPGKPRTTGHPAGQRDLTQPPSIAALGAALVLDVAASGRYRQCAEYDVKPVAQVTLG